MRPLPEIPIESLVGRTDDQVIELLGLPNQRSPGEFWWSPTERTAVRLCADRLEPEEVYGPLPNRISPGQPYEQWHYSYGETLEEASRANPGPWPAVPEGESWWLYLTTTDGALRVVEVAAYPAGVSF